LEKTRVKAKNDIESNEKSQAFIVKSKKKKKGRKGVKLT